MASKMLNSKWIMYFKDFLSTKQQKQFNVPNAQIIYI